MIEELKKALEADPTNPFLQGHVEALEHLERNVLGPSDATACSGFRVTLEAVGLTKAHAMAQAVRVLALMMEEAHTKGHCCGTVNGNASAKLDVIP
jgi:hypothetical protein